jgi:hypothetical protein
MDHNKKNRLDFNQKTGLFLYTIFQSLFINFLWFCLPNMEIREHRQTYEEAMSERNHIVPIYAVAAIGGFIFCYLVELSRIKK